MKYLKKFFSIGIVFLFFQVGVSAEGTRGTSEEAVAMVKKAVRYLKANGLEKTVAEVHNPKGQFIDRDLYITIARLNGESVANGANSRVVGKNLIEVRDVDGRYFQKERTEMAKAKGTGWQTYRMVNPQTQAIELKALYFERVDDLIIGCGVYKG